MTARFFVAAQWQGSSSARAMQVAEGAALIRGDLPESATTDIAVPLGAGSDQGSLVRRLSSLSAVRESLAQALRSSRELPIVIGGDCGVGLAAIEHAARGGRLAVLWLDAHGDLNTPESSPSGAFHGMVLRTLLGDGDPALTPEHPLSPARVVLAGTRALDEAESEYVAASGIRMLTPSQLSTTAVTEALIDSGADALYIHVDLDVLDPAEFGSLGFPEPFGVSLSQLLELIAAAKTALPLVGAGVTEFAPASATQADDDLPTILRIIAALTATTTPIGDSA
jgi:arginase